MKSEARRWMLVDDNEEILSLMSAVLENLTDAGIECHGSPQSALGAFAAAPEQYEVVITDFEMPGMDGVELCRRMLAIFPAQKIFLATGSGFYSEKAAQQAGFRALLCKPFPLETLRATLTKARLEMATACAT